MVNSPEDFFTRLTEILNRLRTMPRTAWAGEQHSLAGAIVAFGDLIAGPSDTLNVMTTSLNANQILAIYAAVQPYLAHDNLPIALHANPSDRGFTPEEVVEAAQYVNLIAQGVAHAIADYAASAASGPQVEEEASYVPPAVGLSAFLAASHAYYPGPAAPAFDPPAGLFNTSVAVPVPPPFHPYQGTPHGEPGPAAPAFDGLLAALDTTMAAAAPPPQTYNTTSQQGEPNPNGVDADNHEETVVGACSIF